jgi:molecular chaperone DnaK
MVKEAEENAEEDKKRREEVEARNAADQLIFSTDKTIEDLGDKVDAEEKEKAENAKEELKTALEGTDMEEINAKKAALEEILQGMSMKLYEQMAQEQQAEGGSTEGGESADDDVIDADFKEVDDEEDKK